MVRRRTAENVKKKTRRQESEKPTRRREREREFSPQEILRVMGEKNHPLLLKELLRDLALKKDQRRTVKEVLQAFLHEGKIVRIRGNRYGLPAKMNLVIGKLKCHPDGYGFVISEKEGEEDVFIGARNLREAMHGDRVVARVESVRKKGKEGTIIRILERKVRKIVGKFMKGKNYSTIIPEDEKILQEIFIPEGETKRARPNQIVVAEMTQYPTDRTRPEGRVVQILGHPDDPEVEVQIILHKYDLPHRFASAAVKEAQKLPASPLPHEYKDRIDLRDVPTFTIDGETARDFDDAVSIEKEKDGGTVLYVSISDVSHYVKEGTALDEEAYLRGTSVYFPDRAISMFPTELSNEICCLHPRVDRLTLTVELKYDPEGRERGIRFYPSVICSYERLTYTIVKKILLDRDGELRRRYAPLVSSLEEMAHLSQELRQKRVDRGALDFDLPEPEVLLNLQGEAEDIIRAERNLAHQIIEEFMIAANEAVARFMERKRLPFVYRIHEPPSQEAIEEFRRFVSFLGFRMKKESYHSPKEFQRILSEAKGRTEEKVINNVLLRSMKWAKYSSQPVGHFGLASEAYTHFTSPIRRYPDLMVHRLLKRALRQEEERVQEEELARKAEHLSHRERVAMEAEREIVDRYRVRLMKERVGEVFEGVITGVTAFGFFVELKEIFVEGLVRVTSLSDDYYHYEEKRYCLMGERTHKMFRVGDKVKVKLVRVDVERRQIDLVLVK
jgi:ribonuclease R